MCSVYPTSEADDMRVVEALFQLLTWRGNGRPGYSIPGCCTVLMREKQRTCVGRWNLKRAIDIFGGLMRSVVAVSGRSGMCSIGNCKGGQQMSISSFQCSSLIAFHRFIIEDSVILCHVARVSGLHAGTGLSILSAAHQKRHAARIDRVSFASTLLLFCFR